MLSFTTTLTVAVEQGIAVYPYPWAGDGRRRRTPRSAARPWPSAGARAWQTGAVSLSPASFDGVAGIERVVLPSPNGSAISFALAEAGVTVVGACLRNAGAVGAWLRDRRPATVAVVAAGERWPDGSLRPAVEDLWGAGAVLAALGADGVSPEARAGRGGVRRACADDLASALRGVRQWARAGRGRLRRATWRSRRRYDVSEVVPVLHGDAFVDAQAQSSSTPLACCRACQVCASTTPVGGPMSVSCWICRTIVLGRSWS